jgi:hypothetical protein
MPQSGGLRKPLILQKFLILARHNVYTPFVIRQKLDVLRDTVNRQIPEFRAGLAKADQ